MSATVQIPIPTVGDELRRLERQVDALCEQPGFEIPSSARIILRSVSSLLMAARHLWEDHRMGGRE